MFRNVVNKINQKVSSFLGTRPLAKAKELAEHQLSIIEGTQINDFLDKHLYSASKYLDSKRITRFHKSVYTQNGEDGIIEEIFNRVGTTNKKFVEFGVHGVKNNSTYLLIKGWKGLWIGGNEKEQSRLMKKFFQQLKSDALHIKRAWITKDNIESLIEDFDIPHDFDFLSIDLDGNDYWVWKAISKFKPRVVSIEYNSSFPSGIEWVMTYNENHIWDQSNYFGASLKSFEKLGLKKGYKLVGCDFTGCNAFFVREDLVDDQFEGNYSSEYHYEPARYFLKKPSGHRQNFGPFVSNAE